MKDKYRPSIARNAALGALVEGIGERYYGISRPAGTDMMSNLMSMFGGGGGGGGGMPANPFAALAGLAGGGGGGGRGRPAIS